MSYIKSQLETVWHLFVFFLSVYLLHQSEKFHLENILDLRIGAGKFLILALMSGALCIASDMLLFSQEDLSNRAQPFYWVVQKNHFYVVMYVALATLSQEFLRVTLLQYSWLLMLIVTFVIGFPHFFLGSGYRVVGVLLRSILLGKVFLHTNTVWIPIAANIMFMIYLLNRAALFDFMVTPDGKTPSEE